MNTEKIKQLRAKAERELAEAKRLEELDAKITQQVKATILADYARGYKPADIARVLKVDRKTVTEILRNRDGTPTVCGGRISYLEERRRQHQGIGRNQKKSWITIGKPRHDELQKCPCCRKHFPSPDLTYAVSVDGQKAYDKEIRNYNKDVFFPNGYPEKTPTTRTTVRPTTTIIPPEMTGISAPNIPTIPENLTEQQQNFIDMKTEETRKVVDEQSKPTEKKGLLGSFWKRNRIGKLTKKITKLSHATVINEEKLAEARKELNSLTQED